jgi:hypothetical protein
MTKIHLENTNNDEKWQGNNKKTRMPTKNNEIATSNSWGVEKTHYKHLKEHMVG